MQGKLYSVINVIPFCEVSSSFFKVGSIVAIGIYGKTGIPKKQIINIALAWFVTVPTSALLSAAIMKLLLAIKPI